MQRSAFALGIAAALLFSGFAQADDVKKVAVFYGDLDLARAEQATELYGRIQRAAHEVCDPGRPGASIVLSRGRAMVLESRCVSRAVDKAVQHVDNPNLTAIYLAKSGKRSMLASSR
jgi:UrcA family protein